MRADAAWRGLGWRHSLWELVRYHLSLQGEGERRRWLDSLLTSGSLEVRGSDPVKIAPSDTTRLVSYLAHRGTQLQQAAALLRTEEDALSYCRANSIIVGTTATRSRDHHQASKALVAAVSAIAQRVTSSRGHSAIVSPQSRCVWCANGILHVSARRLDGAIESLANPKVVWEIKEYWGKTAGGSKMSDAVYECNLVGRELRDFEDRASISVAHVVFVDGKEQWASRKSDLTRLLDLLNQGLIDLLLVGREVETAWEDELCSILK